MEEGFNNSKSGSNYDNLFDSVRAHTIADWLVGVNINKLYSCLYNESYSVGRVQTPTLSMTMNRDDEINSSKKEEYYTVETSINGFTLSADRIDDKIVAEQLEDLVGEKVEITDVIKRERVTKLNLPFDLTTLRRECNKYFGYSAKQTLDYTQSLYEKKYITYPRADSRYLTVDMIESTANNIIGKNNFDAERTKVVFNSEKVTNYHAIIPAISSLNKDISDLPESETEVCRLIANKLYTSFRYPLVENTTKTMAEFDRFKLINTYKVIAEEGFTKYLEEYKSKEKENIQLPDIKIGDFLYIENKDIKEEYTNPPKHFTEDTLLEAVEIAGNDELVKDVEVERKRLGTPATRAGIIENLIYRGYIKKEKKNLISARKGLNLVTIVVDEFKSLKTTVRWEMRLSSITKGKEYKENFLKGIEEEVEDTISRYYK